MGDMEWFSVQGFTNPVPVIYQTLTSLKKNKYSQVIHCENLPKYPESIKYQF